MGVIDFSLYLRRGPPLSPVNGGLGADVGERSVMDAFHTAGDNLATVLDQKNYIEELNRHLK